MTGLDIPGPTDEGDVPDARRVEATDGSEIQIKTPGDALGVPYHRIDPPHVPYDEYNTAQRRAVLLDRIERVGHPEALNQTYSELADEFDVAKSTIHRDMTVLSAWSAENVEREHVSIMDMVFRGAVLQLVEDGDMLEAAEVGKEWFDWLAQMGVIDRVPDRLDMRATVREVGAESESYEVLDADELADLREHAEDAEVVSEP